MEAVCSALEELQKKLRAAESQVTMLELEKNLLDLQLITKTSKLRRDLERDLQGAKDAAARAYKESTDAKARARKLDGDLAAKTIEVTALREDLAFIRTCAHTPGDAAAWRHREKLDSQYPHRVAGSQLVPLVAETGGRWHDSVPTLARAAHRSAPRSSMPS